MRKRALSSQSVKMIHVRLTEKLHRLLRMRVAKEDSTIQDWVFKLIQNELERSGR